MNKAAHEVRMMKLRLSGDRARALLHQKSLTMRQQCSDAFRELEIEREREIMRRHAAEAVTSE